jgi:hypothetical protein
MCGNFCNTELLLRFAVSSQILGRKCIVFIAFSRRFCLRVAIQVAILMVLSCVTLTAQTKDAGRVNAKTEQAKQMNPTGSSASESLAVRPAFVSPCTDPVSSCYVCIPSANDDCGIGGDGGGNTPEQPPDGGGGGSAPPDATVRVSSPGNIPYGQAVTNPMISAIVSTTSGPVLTGTVDFSTNAPSVPAAEEVPLRENTGTSSIADWNMATMSGNPVIPVGNYAVTAAYSGDEDYSEATGSESLSILPADSESQISNCPSGPVTAGQAESFSVSVSWRNTPTTTTLGIATPTGQVILYDSLNSTGATTQTVGALGTFPGTSSTATIRITATGSGIHTIKVSYQGDRNYDTSTSESCTMTVVAH